MSCSPPPHSIDFHAHVKRRKRQIPRIRESIRIRHNIWRENHLRVAVLETCACVMREVDIALLKESLEDLAKLAIYEVLELPEENGGMPSDERDYSSRPEDFPMPVQFLAAMLTDNCAAAVRMRKLLAKACGDGLLPSEFIGEILADFWGDNEDDEYNLATHGTISVVQMLDWLNDKWSADPDNSLLGWPGCGCPSRVMFLLTGAFNQFWNCSAPNSARRTAAWMAPLRGSCWLRGARANQ